jgi:hypothetical protein
MGQNARVSCCLLTVVFAIGCGAGTTLTSTPIVSANSTKIAIQGTVHGGQQPVSGATIQLYTAGAPTTGGGYGLGSVPLITGILPVTDSNGNFSITGDYVVPPAASHFYIVATGGSPGVGLPANNNIALMAVLDGCTATVGLSPTLETQINEVTTVAAVTALQPFMAAPAAGNTGAPAIGAPATAYNALQNAFATANNLANSSTGVALKHANSYATTDQNALVVNSLANTLAYCINSSLVNGQCSSLASNARPASATFLPADTIQSAWYIAQNPTNNVPALFNLQSSAAPFIGLSTAPASFSTPVVTSGSACQAPVNLGTAANYAVVAYSTITNSSTVPDQTTILGGNVGLSPGTAETGFVTGTYVATFDNADAAAAKSDLSTAYTNAAGLLLPAVLPTDLSGLTFTPGLYSTASTVTLNSGSVTLDGQGDSNAVFIFQIGSTFTAAGGTQVLLINGASAANVFWQVGTSATINGAAAWQGNILAYASISLGTDATLQGRALAENGAVTLLSNKITAP